MLDIDPIAYQAFLDAATEKFDFASTTCQRKDGTRYGIPGDSECQTGTKVTSKKEQAFVKKGDQDLGTVAGPGMRRQAGQSKVDSFWSDQRAAFGAMNAAIDRKDLQGIASATRQLKDVAARHSWVSSIQGHDAQGQATARQLKAKYNQINSTIAKNTRLLQKKGISVGGGSQPRQAPAPRQNKGYTDEDVRRGQAIFQNIIMNPALGGSGSSGGSSYPSSSGGSSGGSGLRWCKDSQSGVTQLRRSCRALESDMGGHG